MQIALLPVTTNPLPMLNMIMFPFKVKVLWCTSSDGLLLYWNVEFLHMKWCTTVTNTAEELPCPQHSQVH